MTVAYSLLDDVANKKKTYIGRCFFLDSDQILIYKVECLFVSEAKAQERPANLDEIFRGCSLLIWQDLENKKKTLDFSWGKVGKFQKLTFFLYIIYDKTPLLLRVIDTIRTQDIISSHSAGVFGVNSKYRKEGATSLSSSTIKNIILIYIAKNDKNSLWSII